MMRCPSCGMAVEVGAGFCPYCGVPLGPRGKPENSHRRGTPWWLIGGIVLLILVIIATLVVRILWNRKPGAPPEAAPETTAPSAPVQDDTAERARALLEDMSREERIYQLFLVRPEAVTGDPCHADDTLAQALARRPVGGLLLTEENLESREQCQELLARFQAAAGIPLLLGTTQEGTAPFDYLTDLRTSGIPETTGSLGAGNSASKTQQAYETMCKELAALGFNLNLAPVADVNSNPENAVMGDRAFGARPEQVSNLVAAAVRGSRAAEVMACAKHFPGHGDVTAAEEGFCQSDKPLEELKRCELLPFRSAIQEGVPAILVSADVFPAVDNKALPACLSPAMVSSLLRGELGYAGVILTSPLSGSAMERAYPGGEAAVMALEAGCDLLLVPADLDAAASAIAAALDSGRLTEARLEESVLRILELKLTYGLLERDYPPVSSRPTEPVETAPEAEEETAPEVTVTALPGELTREEVAALEAAVQQDVNFLASIYKQPKEIDPNCVLHSGGPCHTVTQAERDALAAAHGEEFLTENVVKFTAGELDPYFEERCGVPFRQLLIKPGKNTMPYLEDYDAYYILWDESQNFTLTAAYARRNEDGSYTLGYRNPKEGNAGFEVTFRLEAGRAIFLANQRAS